MRTAKLARGALTLSVIVVSFIFFRGTTSILNSIVVPLALYIFLGDFNIREWVTTLLAALILVAIFFGTQIIFMGAYGLLAFLLSAVSGKKMLLRTIMLTSGAVVSFITAIYLTDLFLGTSIQQALTSLVGGDQLNFYFLVLGEGIFTGTVLAFTSSAFEKRLDI